MLHQLLVIWKAFTYKNGKFSRSGFLRTVFNLQLILAYGFVVWTTVPTFGLTWELVMFTALCQGLLIADYRGLIGLKDLKPGNDFGGGGGWWNRGRADPKSPATTDIEGPL